MQNHKLKVEIDVNGVDELQYETFIAAFSRLLQEVRTSFITDNPQAEVEVEILEEEE